MGINDGEIARVLNIKTGEPFEIGDSPSSAVSTTDSREILEKNYAEIIREWLLDIPKRYPSFRFSKQAVDALVDFFANKIPQKIGDRESFCSTFCFLVSLWASENIIHGRYGESIVFEPTASSEAEIDHYVLTELTKTHQEHAEKEIQKRPCNAAARIRNWVLKSIDRITASLKLLRFCFEVATKEFNFEPPWSFIDSKNHSNGKDEETKRIIEIVRKLVFDDKTQSMTIASAAPLTARPLDAKPRQQKRLSWLADWKREETMELRGIVRGRPKITVVTGDHEIQVYRRLRPAADKKYTFEELHGIKGDPPQDRFKVAIDLLMQESRVENMEIDFQKARENFNTALGILRRRIEAKEALNAEQAEQDKPSAIPPSSKEIESSRKPVFTSLHDRRMLLNPKPEELESFKEVISSQIESGETFLRPVAEMHVKFPEIPVEVIFNKWLKNPAKSRQGLEQSLAYMSKRDF